MTFFKSLMKVLSAAGASALLILIPKLVALFSGPAPSDISAVVWGIIGTVAVFALNYFVGKIPAPAPE